MNKETVLLIGAVLFVFGILITAAEARAGWPQAGPLLTAFGLAFMTYTFASETKNAAWYAVAVFIAYTLYLTTIPSPLQVYLSTITAAAVIITLFLAISK